MSGVGETTIYLDDFCILRSRLITAALTFLYVHAVYASEFVETFECDLAYLCIRECCIFSLRHAQASCCNSADDTCAHLTHIHAIISYAFAIYIMRT